MHITGKLNIASHGKTNVEKGFLARVAEIFRARRNRRRVVELSRLDNHLLHDIGLARPDLSDALGVGWLDDPTDRLNKLRRDRIGR